MTFSSLMLHYNKLRSSRYSVVKIMYKFVANKPYKKILASCIIGTLFLLTLRFNIYFKNYYKCGALKDCSSVYVKNPNMKYVLKYNPSRQAPFNIIPEGSSVFINRNCYRKNCYITSNRALLGEVTAFDVVLFNGPIIVRRRLYDSLPRIRSSNQTYIFVNTESSDYYYISNFRYNGVFNFTWTYKLSSDIYFGYISVWNRNGEVIAPGVNVSWVNVDDMLPIDDRIKEKLKHKRLAAAWFVSNCRSPNKREKWALKIHRELAKYNMTLDIYGRCWFQDCPRKEMNKCFEMLQRDYFFYIAFENSMSEDYVTEKLLTALNNYAVPVVYGGADYKRFMPDGIYLNARGMSVGQLVKQMVEIINDENKYHSFFKWHNHYTYKEPSQNSYTDSFCEFCDFINKIDYNKSTYIDNFFEWWNPHIEPVNYTLLKDK